MISDEGDTEKIARAWETPVVILQVALDLVVLGGFNWYFEEILKVNLGWGFNRPGKYNKYVNQTIS